jgi:hypothetical protein
MGQAWTKIVAEVKSANLRFSLGHMIVNMTRKKGKVWFVRVFDVTYLCICIRKHRRSGLYCHHRARCQAGFRSLYRTLRNLSPPYPLLGQAPSLFVIHEVWKIVLCKAECHRQKKKLHGPYKIVPHEIRPVRRSLLAVSTCRALARGAANGGRPQEFATAFTHEEFHRSACSYSRQRSLHRFYAHEVATPVATSPYTISNVVA